MKILLAFSAIFVLIFILIVSLDLLDREKRNVVFQAKTKYGVTLNPVKAAFIYHHVRWASIDDMFCFFDVIMYAPIQMIGQFVVNKYENNKTEESWGSKLNKQYKAKELTYEYKKF